MPEPATVESKSLMGVCRREALADVGGEALADIGREASTSTDFLDAGPPSTSAVRALLQDLLGDRGGATLRDVGMHHAGRVTALDEHSPRAGLDALPLQVLADAVVPAASDRPRVNVVRGSKVGDGDGAVAAHPGHRTGTPPSVQREAVVAAVPTTASGHDLARQVVEEHPADPLGAASASGVRKVPRTVVSRGRLAV